MSTDSSATGPGPPPPAGRLRLRRDPRPLLRPDQRGTYLAGFLAVGPWSLRRHLREPYQPARAKAGSARPQFGPPSLCFGPLPRGAAGDNPDRRLVPALDPTNLTGRFRVLCAAAPYRGGGLPVAWAAQAAGEKGSWNDVWSDLLGALGGGWAVLVLTDRGLEPRDLSRAIRWGGPR